MRLSFGKHRGLTVAQVAAVDPGYVRWLAREARLDQEMCQALEAEVGPLCERRPLASIKKRTGELCRELVILEPRYLWWQVYMTQDQKDTLAKALGIPVETQQALDVGSEHPYTCRCPTCKRWWVEMGAANAFEVAERGEEPDYGPFTAEEIEGK